MIKVWLAASEWRCSSHFLWRTLAYDVQIRTANGKQERVTEEICPIDNTLTKYMQLRFLINHVPHWPEEMHYLLYYKGWTSKTFKTSRFSYLEARSLHVNKSPIHLVTQFLLLYVNNFFVWTNNAAYLGIFWKKMQILKNPCHAENLTTKTPSKTIEFYQQFYLLYNSFDCIPYWISDLRMEPGLGLLQPSQHCVYPTLSQALKQRSSNYEIKDDIWNRTLAKLILLGRHFKKKIYE